MTRERSWLALIRAFFSVMFSLMAVCSIVVAKAQTSTVGSISGTVRDLQGAVIPKAQVLIQEERTGLSRTVLTNDDGFYSAPSLPFGHYSVSTAPSGFKRLIISAVELHVSENIVVNLTLEIGLVSETVNVNNETLVVTRNSSVSSLIQRSKWRSCRSLHAIIRSSP
ncbi:MAG TPA: carboxypeptidase-like regulatory domain-containing protein [Blastocatellia bacterium]|nr:carboxypeptidase-like regulatory domain-containing protein [Blastocatellia bacterium]